MSNRSEGQKNRRTTKETRALKAAILHYIHRRPGTTSEGVAKSAGDLWEHADGDERRAVSHASAYLHALKSGGFVESGGSRNRAAWFLTDKGRRAIVPVAERQTTIPTPPTGAAAVDLPFLALLADASRREPGVVRDLVNACALPPGFADVLESMGIEVGTEHRIRHAVHRLTVHSEREG